MLNKEIRRKKKYNWQRSRKKIIKEPYSPFTTSVTLAYEREEGKKNRVCIDFRDLNKNIVPQAQPFPLIDDLIKVQTVNILQHWN